MTSITLKLSKTTEENASIYFERSKKAKKKLECARKALEITKKKVAKAEKEEQKLESRAQQMKKVARKKEWYEKFRWFVSSKGFLVIGGRDATTNEIVIKKHAVDGDLVFHTDMTGSPFVVIKAEGKKIDEQTIKEAAQFCASNSRAWQRKLGVTEVYYIRPDQVRKELGLPKGSFMIHGKRNYQTPVLELAIGLKGDAVMCAPAEAVAAYAKEHIIIKPGDIKKSDLAKRIRKELKVEADNDDIIRVLPPGESQIEKKR